MGFFDRLPRFGLRARLLALNAVVVLAMAFLALQAWRASASQDAAQVEQVRLSEALRLTMRSDMHHDATRGNLMSTLLMAQQGYAMADLQRAVAADSAALLADLRALSAMGLPEPSAAKLALQLPPAQRYGDLARNVSAAAAERDVLTSVPLRDFELAHQDLLQGLSGLGEAVSTALDDSRQAAAQAAESARWAMLVVCGFTIALASLVVFVITQSIRARLRAMAAVAAAIAGGDLTRRTRAQGDDELGGLGRAIDQMAHSLNLMIDGTRADASRAQFGKQLAEALDMADRETQVAQVAARAMVDISPRHSMELLVSDSSQAQLERAAQHPGAGAAGCGVSSPYGCVAVRRGSLVSFEHSDSLNACTHLRGRACGSVSAVCVPVTFMGRAIGVLHAAGSVDEPLQAHQAQQLATLGGQIGMRIGTVRAFEKTQLQAATDSLTGLPNRRTLEDKLRTLAAAGQAYAVVMADLDRFKLLNDTHGHAAGDSALRLFAEVMRASLRGQDVSGRWGGEEFAFVLVGADATTAKSMTDRLRKRLANQVAMGRGPTFTASFGIADSSMSARPEDLIQLADVALYQAKASGRDRACLADPAAQAAEPSVRHAEPSPQGIDQGALLATME